jgi:hypothetical protein
MREMVVGCPAGLPMGAAAATGRDMDTCVRESASSPVDLLPEETSRRGELFHQHQCGREMDGAREGADRAGLSPCPLALAGQRINDGLDGWSTLQSMRWVVDREMELCALLRGRLGAKHAR